MQRDEFERELARYARVRGADYRAGWVVEAQTRVDEQPRAGQGAAEAKVRMRVRMVACRCATGAFVCARN